MGVFSFKTHYFKNKNKEYNTARKFFKALKPRQYYCSNRLKDLILDLSTNLSYRITEKITNKIRLKCDKKGIKSRSVCNLVDREGTEIHNNINAQVEDIFDKYDFTDEGMPVDKSDYQNKESLTIDELEINRVIKENELYIDAKYKNPKLYEKEAYNISVDDVYVKKQKEKRKNDEESEEKKQIRGSVAHVEKDSNKMILNSINIKQVLLFVLGLVLNSGFTANETLVFFVDGEKKIHKLINTMFSWTNYKIILDWAHIIKKCKENLSMAIKNKKTKIEVMEKILYYTWYGKTDSVIEYLQSIPKENIKSTYWLGNLIGYFERNRNNIPCYCIRKYLNLRNSSNRGEKANDLVISKRQKHNGMSWSVEGSNSQASVCSVYKNNQSENWIKNHEIKFDLSA